MRIPVLITETDSYRWLDFGHEVHAIERDDRERHSWTAECWCEPNLWLDSTGEHDRFVFVHRRVA